jgi:hypothetical protein
VNWPIEEAAKWSDHPWRKMAGSSNDNAYQNLSGEREKLMPFIVPQCPQCGASMTSASEILMFTQAFIGNEYDYTTNHVCHICCHFWELTLCLNLDGETPIPMLRWQYIGVTKDFNPIRVLARYYQRNERSSEAGASLR